MDFSHQVQGLKSGDKIFQVKTSTVATRKKFHKLNARIWHYSCTIHNSRNDIVHALRHYSQYHTNNKHTTQNTQKHYLMSSNFCPHLIFKFGDLIEFLYLRIDFN